MATTAELLATERRFLIERSYQFISFGVVVLGLGLNACLGNTHSRATPLVFALLFGGATWIGLSSLAAYRHLVGAERTAAAATEPDSPGHGFVAPDYTWLFRGGIAFGLLSILAFGYLAWVACPLPVAAPTPAQVGPA